MEQSDIKQCCATFYGSDIARFLLGESFHPGGTKLTERLGTILSLTPQSSVLDVAAGRGTSAFHLAKVFGCHVTGIDLSEENVRLATTEAQQRGLADRVSFQLGDAERLLFDDNTFDTVVCECAFCTFPSKPAAAKEFFRVLKPTGRIGLSDLTRTEEPIAGLEGLLSWIACIGDASPVEQYTLHLEQAGFEVQTVEDHSDALLEMVQQVQARLLGAEVLAGLKKISLPGVDFATGRQFAQAVLQATRNGALGYTAIAAKKP